MISISRLYCGTIKPSDVLRYGRESKKLPSHLLHFSQDKKPVIVYNCTQRCNLKCVHCYSHSSSDSLCQNELTTAEAKAFIEDIAAFGSPVILFSGGEPLMRPDIFELIDHACAQGLRAVLSTNGTLITEKTVKKLKTANISYVGISLDGIEGTNDAFRGVPGAFDRALSGIRNCIQEGIKVGLRFTINKRNASEIEPIFRLLEDENIPRVCFYHLVYSGRGTQLIDEALPLESTRRIVDQILDLTRDLHQRGLPKEVLTVDNHCDGPYTYLRMLRNQDPLADDVYQLLQYNGGNSSGIGIGCVSWDGSVHPDQFWRHYTFGNVRDRKFSQIWTDTSDVLMAKLKDRKPHLKGRCAQCKWLNICNGNFRVRAEAKTGDLWACDPACYLTDQEIGIAE
ncbi:12,18-didecarboxysiroheme deacetylase [candidate division KSB3 bacterium]|uniref:12,18-didecarboxysiroheme deacetylase n=1 Tax=candidate division KSB3 bacterium TaxID=2044937 RepID=A0A9D5JSG7_9BACT|nr:12,18-didecarboxysiroheme deacetylase [candidate division KSB3 bacterium]MBD3323432.1 12,18-didecarboxysiroheme deacetylase [candidate division KSB3 bacterium]